MKGPTYQDPNSPSNRTTTKWRLHLCQSSAEM